MMQMNFIASQSGKRIGKSLLTLVLGGVLTLALTKPLLVMTGLFAHDVSSSARQIVYIALAILALFGAILNKGLSRLIPLPVPIIMILAWFSITTTWSLSPSASLQKLALTSLVTWLCFIASDRVSSTRIIVIIRFILAILLFANYLTVIMYPSVGVHDYAAASSHQWRGIMSHKNIAGMTSAITILFFVFHGQKGTIIPRYFVVLFSTIFLYFSDSRTSLIGVSASLIAGAIFYYFPAKITSMSTKSSGKVRIIGYASYFILASGLVFFTLSINVLIQLTSNPDFLSGRSQIWQPLLTTYAEHPILGTGYGAFWSNLAETSSRLTREKGNFLTGATQGHNGYLDIAVQTGLVGLLITIVAITAWPVRYLIRYVELHKDVCSLASAVIVLYLIDNFTETSLFEGDHILHIFTMIVFGMLQKIVRRSGTVGRRGNGTIVRKLKVSTL
jgi:exopolysaccharide production protein ExoQ